MSFSLRFFDAADGSGGGNSNVTAILPASARTFFRDRLRELCGSALALVAFSLLVSFISYRPGDPSLNSATNLAPSNLVGHSGAIIADILVQSFGYAAYLLSFGLLGWSWRIIRKQRLSQVGWRGIALILSTVAGSVGLSSLPVADGWLLATRMGGVVGTMVYDHAVSLVTATGWPHAGVQIAIAAAC